MTSDTPRRLTVTPIAVPAEREDRYLALARRLAARCGEHGGHFWLFRSADDPRAFLEFRESPGPRPPARSADEEAVERDLDLVAPRERPGAVWVEVHLKAQALGEDGAHAATDD